MRHGSSPRLMALQPIRVPNPGESEATPLAGVRMTWPGVAGCSGPAAGSAPHTRRPRIGVVHPMAEHVVEEDRDLARRCGDRLGLADAGRQTAVEGAQR